MTWRKSVSWKLVVTYEVADSYTTASWFDVCLREEVYWNNVPAITSAYNNRAAYDWGGVQNLKFRYNIYWTWYEWRSSNRYDANIWYNQGYINYRMVYE